MTSWITDKTGIPKKVIILCSVSFLCINAIALMKDAMELEDAEQSYYSQWLRWGYDDQPPLYTWLQYSINQVFGVSKLSFSLLRSLIFSGILAMTYLFSNAMLKNRKKSELAIFCLVFIPVLIDFTFRRLSHTALLILAVICSYMVLNRLIKRKSVANYVLFGIAVGIGLLSKYNYMFFLATLVASMFVDKSLRRIYYNRYIVISIIIALVMVWPHYYWLLDSKAHLLELRESVDLKMDTLKREGTPIIAPFAAFLISFLKLTALLIAAAGLLILLKKLHFKKPKMDWLSKLFYIQFAVLLCFFLLFGSSRVEVRWLLPLFFPFIIVLLRYVVLEENEQLSSFGFYIFLGILAIQLIRTPIEKLMSIPSSVHFGFQPLSDKLGRDYSTKQWLLPNVTYAGNVRLQDPKREILATDDFSLPKNKMSDFGKVKVYLDRKRFGQSIPSDSLVNFGREGVTVYFIED